MTLQIVSLRYQLQTTKKDLTHEKVINDHRVIPLRWYQIEQDEKLIRRERLKGTTPAEFVERFVLPFTRETEAKFLETYGEHIYTH